MEDQSEEDLMFLLAHDSDPFSRWEAGQRLMRSLLLHLYSAAARVTQVGLACQHQTWTELASATIWLKFSQAGQSSIGVAFGQSQMRAFWDAHAKPSLIL